MTATTELQGGDKGIASIFESTLTIDTGRGVPKLIVRDRTDDSVEGERSEAVQAAGSINGDAGRTSVSDAKVNEEESLDTT